VTEHGVHPDPSIADLFFPAINFLIFALVVWRYLAGPVREFFRARTERLRDALTAGARARGEAGALRAQIQRDLDGLPALRERLQADIRETAARERDDLLEQARRVAVRIREDARLLADYEVAAARRVVRAEASDEAIRRAVELVRASVGPADHERFVREFVASAGQAS
jgi:F-type H+-transporting ATPase subunit b